MKILFVLQTHTVSNSQDKPGKKMQRYTGTDKAEVTKRCVRSLIKSINHCQQQQPDVEYHLHVYDDHSDQLSLDILKANLAMANFKTTLESLETRGIMPSILACYKYGREHGTDLIYFVQDDYLFQETAIWEMVDMYFQAVQVTGKRICICPYDHPYRYDIRPPTVGPILLGKKRHWKVAYHTPATFMFHHDTIMEDWDLFEDLTRQDPLSEMCEDLTINKLFRERGALLFTPIPSCALHIQYGGEKDPYIDWTKWWDEHKDPEQGITIYKIDTVDSILNLGFGGLPLKNCPQVDDLLKLKEITVDIDPSRGPNILASMESLPMIEDGVVGVVYSSHSLEHLAWHKIPACLKEWYRICAPNGHIRIIVPNLQAIAEYLVNGNILDVIYNSSGGAVSAIDMIYGHRGHVARGNDFMSHKTGFTKKSMTQLLTELGYKKFTVEEDDINLITKIYK
jgi:hypothetical protein